MNACLYGVYKWVDVINPNQNHKRVKVDACIADEIQWLNNKGVVTLGCCCGHGNAGKIVEWENVHGKWKGYGHPPHTLIQAESVDLAKSLGYRPFPYYHADGNMCGLWRMELKTGCITLDDCEKWHRDNDIPFVRDVGVVAESRA